MAPHERPYPKRGCFFIFLFIPLGVFVLGLIFYISMHFGCRSSFDTWVIDYPNAEFVEDEYSWLMPYSIGETVRVLYSPDAPAVVRRWYNAEYRALEDDGHIRSYGAGRVNWQVVTAEDGEGSIIYIFCSCSPRMALWSN